MYSKRYTVGTSESTPKGIVFHGPKFSCDPDKRGIGAYLFDKLEEYKDKICQICAVTGKRETFSSVKLRSTRAAIGLMKLQIQPKDVIMICSNNNMDALITLLGTQYIGGITASIDPSFSVRDMAHLIRLSKPRCIFLESDSITNVTAALKEAEVQAKIIVYGEAKDHLKFSSFLKPSTEEKDFKPIVVNNKEIAFILFSSGTTGLPKGLMISHYAIFYASLSILAFNIDFRCILHFSTLYWVSALNLTFIVLTTGGSKLVCPKFDPNTAFKYIEKYKVTYAFLASPYIYKLQDENICPYDTTSFSECMFGGGSINAQQMTKIRKLLPHTKVSLAYGMSEVSGFLSGYNSYNDFTILEKKPENSGYPLAGITMRIVDPDTEKQLGFNETGEIRIKSSSLFLGYYNSDSQDVFDADGWLKSGDIGYFDKDNFLYVIDRIKEMFKFQSWHVVPASIEAIIFEHPSVQETAVIGVPNEIDGDHPMALVVLKKDHQHVTPEELIKFVDDRVIDRQRLRAGVKIVDYIPKTSTGKIQRRLLREMVLKGKLQ